MKKLILILLLSPIYTLAQSTFGTATLSKIYISLKKDSSNTYTKVDGAVLAFSSNFGNSAYGPQDALKFGNSNDNLSISDKGKNLSIDGRLPPTANDVIPLSISKVSGKNYQLVVDATNYTSNGVSPYIKDNYTGIDSKLIKDSIKINFNIDSNTNSYSNRFSIGFKNDSILLPINSMVLNTSISDNNVIINWNTIGEKNVAFFEIEKSYDGKSFYIIQKVNAKNTDTASYTYIDNNTNVITYYRIKAIDISGMFHYSNISVINNDIIFNTYPNPVLNILHIQPNNYMIGNSVIHIYSISGKLVLSTNFIFNKNILSINLDNISHGEYILQIFSNHKLYTKTFVK